MSTDTAKAVVRRNTEEVQSRGNFDVFEELFALDFVDHTPQPGFTPDRDGARNLYRTLRAAFPDFHADIHWQAADGELVTTYKTYHGTHQGPFLGLAPTGRSIRFETVDAMRVQNGTITEHWGSPISCPCCSSLASPLPGPPQHTRKPLAALHGRWFRARTARQCQQPDAGAPCSPDSIAAGGITTASYPKRSCDQTRYSGPFPPRGRALLSALKSADNLVRREEPVQSAHHLHVANRR